MSTDASQSAAAGDVDTKGAAASTGFMEKEVNEWIGVHAEANTSEEVSAPVSACACDAAPAKGLFAADEEKWEEERRNAEENSGK